MSKVKSKLYTTEARESVKITTEDIGELDPMSISLGQMIINANLAKEKEKDEKTAAEEEAAFNPLVAKKAQPMETQA